MHYCRTVSLLAVLFLLCSPAMATAQSSWSDPDGSGITPAAAGTDGERMQAMIDALMKELDRGEKERLIDPWFLRDLRGVISRYDFPWGKPVLSDRFDGKGPPPDPPWKVTAGEFLIDWRYGFRSVIDKNRAASSTSSGSSSSGSKSDAAKQLLGALLQGALGGSSSGSESNSQTRTEPAPTFAAIQKAATIPNAFAIDILISSRPLDSGPSDGFEFGPYQGSNAGTGYRLSYIAAQDGDAGELHLLRLSSRGVTIVDRTTQPVTIGNTPPSRIIWTRNGQGRMQVKVDGTTAIDVVDRGFKDPFSGFALLNRGGDIALQEITISGAGS